MIKFFKALVGLGNSYVTGKLENKKAEIDGNNKVRQEELRQHGSWNEIHAKNSASSWKDEWFTLLFSIPLVLAFFPSAVPTVEAGFAALERAPDWYKQALAVLVAASVGYQKLAGLFDKVKGK